MLTRLTISTLAAVILLAACASSPRSTRLTLSDIDDMSASVATGLRASDFLASRTAESEPIIIAMDKVENLSDDLIPRGEQWAIMAKVRGGADIVRLGAERNVRLVISADHLADARRRATLGPDVAVDRAPTHQMSATIRNATRSDGLRRTDVYLCEFRITALATGELEWVETFELKRQAVGRTFD